MVAKNIRKGVLLEERQDNGLYTCEDVKMGLQMIGYHGDCHLLRLPSSPTFVRNFVSGRVVKGEGKILDSRQLLGGFLYRNGYADLHRGIPRNRPKYSQFLSFPNCIQAE